MEEREQQMAARVSSAALACQVSGKGEGWGRGRARKGEEREQACMQGAVSEREMNDERRIGAALSNAQHQQGKQRTRAKARNRIVEWACAGGCCSAAAVKRQSKQRRGCQTVASRLCEAHDCIRMRQKAAPAVLFRFLLVCSSGGFIRMRVPKVEVEQESR